MMHASQTRLKVSLILVTALVLACVYSQESKGGARSTADSSIYDPQFLVQDLWNDGKAELAFYDVQIQWKIRKEPYDQRFTAVSVFVKHLYDPVKLGKAGSEDRQAVQSFNWSFHYDIGSMKRLAAVTVEQRSLQPFKQTFAELSLEGSCYREMALPSSGRGRRFLRCQNHAEPESDLSIPSDAYTAVEIPLIVRSLDFSKRKWQSFKIVGFDGRPVTATAEKLAGETITTPQGQFPAEKIAIRFSARVPYPGGMLTVVNQEETYWRSLRPNRQILQMVSRNEDVEYRIKLIEELRAAYWNGEPLPLKHVEHLP